MTSYQIGILQPVPAQAVYLSANLNQHTNYQVAIETLVNIDVGNDVVGIGQSFYDRFDRSIPMLKSLPEQRRNKIHIPSTPSDLWCWLRGNDQGKLLHRARQMIQQLSPAFDFAGSVEAFRYADGRDLTGYEDGTENPVGEAATEAAILKGDDTLTNGSSFVAVQQWLHDLDVFETFTDQHQDHIIGRRRSDNLELENAPESAHVKRTAQESFDPEAFLLRRSMPWTRELQSGLMFVAFGHSFDAFEAQLIRMIGKEDGIEDGLFEFSRPITGAYYWCPPCINDRLQLHDPARH